MNLTTLRQIESLGLMKKWKDTYVLTAKGQKVFSKSGGDPKFWTHQKDKGMTPQEVDEKCTQIFGSKPGWESEK